MAEPYPERQKEIFGLALELSPDSRGEFVRQQCGEDRPLFEAVMEMIRKHDALPEFFEQEIRFGEGPRATIQTEPLQSDFHGNARFRLIRQLGSGSFGTVFAASDQKENAVVALKVLHRAEAAELRMFKREFRSVADVTHRNLVQLYELIEEGRHWFFTMELVDGPDFISHIRQASALPGAASIDYSRARSALGQLAEAVCYLHQRRMLHRDIKPSNIRVTRAGEVKLLDFGLVRDVSPESASETVNVGGTAAYMAPELLTERRLREESDWYSVGAVLYEALTGEPPFQGGLLELLLRKNEETIRPPREFTPDIPDDLNELCLDLLERRPELRLNGAGLLQRLASFAHRETSVPAEQPRRLRRLIGRDSHLATLREAFEEVRSGGTVSVHVRGESGMGKSALCKWFLAEVRRQGAVVLAGRCYESESVPFKALDPVVDALGDYLKNIRGADVAAFLPREQPLVALSRVFPTLLQVEAISHARSQLIGETSPRDLQKRAMAALREILARIAEKQPCVIHIDDFQWGDLDSVECLASILAPPDPPRVLFLFSYRSEDVASCAHLERLLAFHRNRELFAGRTWELQVDRLNAVESKELVHELLGPEGDVAHQWIDRETEGMPLFIHELALYARTGLSTAASLTAPLSLQEMIQRRASRLPIAARRMIEIVSVAAQPIGVEVLRQMVQMEDGGHSARSVLLAEKLIRFRSTESGGEIEPYHDKIREAIVAALEPEAKREYFESLAAALEAREDADAEMLYQYFLAAGNLSKAQRWIEIAAERAERALAFDLAVRLREERLEMQTAQEPERPLLLERLAEALSLAGRGLKAARTYQAAAQGALPEKYRELVRKAGEQYIRSGHFEEGQALLMALLERSGFRIPAHRWQALLLLLARRSYLRLRGIRIHPRENKPADPQEAANLDICRVTSLALALQDPIRAAELQTRHLFYSLRLGEPYRIANSLAMEAGYVTATGGASAYPKADRLLNRIEELTAQSNHPNARTIGPSVRSKVAWLAGRWEESAILGEEVNRMATEQYTRVAWEAYPSSIFWMASLACMGRWRELMERLPGLQADSQARGDLLETASLPVFTFAYMRWLLADQPERAAAELESARVQLSEAGFIPHRFGIWYGLAEVALYVGDTKQARYSVTQGWNQLEGAMALRLQPVRIFMLHLRARVACAEVATAQQSEQRRRLLAEAMADVRRIRKERTDWGDAISHLVEAGIAVEQQRLEEARRSIEAAEVGCRRVGMDQFLAAARYRKARLMPGQAGREAGRQAAAWFEQQKVARIERIVHMLCPGRWDSIA